MRYKFFGFVFIVALILNSVCWASFFHDDLRSPGIKIVDYSNLTAATAEVLLEFQSTGYIAVKNVPGFAKAYQEFLEQFRAFIVLPDDVKNKYAGTPGSGWSRGTEQLSPGKKDTYKGSFYAWTPIDNPEHPNQWPTEDAPGLEPAFRKLTTIMLDASRNILPMIGFAQEVQGLGRALHYKAVPAGEDDGNPNWCGVHRDHGLLTALAPEIYYRDGQVVARPENAGLYIEGKPVAPAPDILLFQINEVIELLTAGGVCATDHWVQKPTGADGESVERYALAYFTDPLAGFPISCTDKSVCEKYKDRYTDGMTWQQWCALSYAKYNPTK